MATSRAACQYTLSYLEDQVIRPPPPPVPGQLLQGSLSLRAFLLTSNRLHIHRLQNGREAGILDPALKI